MKNRINWFIACIITVTLLLCVAGCQDFLIQGTPGNTIININLDLSKLIKNSRNDDTQINGYVLKLFVYDAKNYQEGDREIEKLPLLTQTSNKVDVNGIVKASLEVAIDSTVIFVGKLFTLNENDVESDKPLYAGKSEAFKVQPKDNKVHLVLSREKSEIGFEIELQESHEHTFSSEWSTSLSHHWKGTTCGHNDVMADFTEHSFSDWTTQQPTEEVAGSKERTCEECNYKEVVEIAKLAHTHKFASDWTYDGTYHWKASTCDHDVTEGKVVHTFGDWETTTYATEDAEGSKERTCKECNYKETAVIEQLAHTHKFEEEWSASLTYHWKAADCEHKDIVSDFGEHDFGEYVSNNDATQTSFGTKSKSCEICGYTDTVIDKKVPEMIEVEGDTIVGAEYKNKSIGVFIAGRTVTLSDFYMGKYEVTQEEYASVMEGQIVTVAGVEYELESNPNYCTKDSNEYTLFNGDVQEKRPVEGVTWYDAVWYCNALSVKEGLSPAYNIEVTQVKQISVTTGYYIYEATVTLNTNATGYRLPTDAEWEYAARGGDTVAADWNYFFSGSDSTVEALYQTTYHDNSGLDSVGWYSYNNITGVTGDSDVTTDVSGKGTHQVGKKEPNRLGIYDMSGNVYEWCYDWYVDVNTGTEYDPTGAESGTERVRRGGGWYKRATYASVSCRDFNGPKLRNNNTGFRVVRSAK